MVVMLLAWGAVAVSGVARSSGMASQDVIPLDLSDERAWGFSVRGKYEGSADRRALFGIVHPWARAEEGDFGEVQREVSIPRDWRPPYTLRFYCCDDYANDEWRPKPDEWLGGEGFLGHRFKQVLINGQVVWESDVADAEGAKAQARFEIDLSRVCAPGETFRLAFRVADKVATDVKLSGDFHHTGSTETQAEKPGDPPRFMTHVYWGDALLVRGRIAKERLAAFERRPSADVVENVHANRWPLKPFGTVRTGPARLRLEMAESVPTGGFPVTCGVPLPAGVVKALDHIALRDPSGRRVALQMAALNRWKDGSLRWVLLDFEAPAGANADGWQMQFGRRLKPVAPQYAVRAQRKGDVVRIATGPITLVFGERREHLIERVIAGRQVLAGALTGEVIVRSGRCDVAYAPRWDRVEVTARGPLRATVEVSGRLWTTASEDEALGRFVLRVNAYGGKPYARMFYRIFNDSGRTVRIKRFGLTLSTEGDARAIWTGNSAAVEPGGTVSLHQQGGGAFVLSRDGKSVENGERSHGWMAVAGERGVTLMAVRNFWQLFPKALRCDLGQMTAELFSQSEQVLYYEPTAGEAKRHEMLLAFLPRDAGEADAAALVRAFSRPRRLFAPDWFCASGGLGYAAPHSETQFPELHRHMAATYGDIGPTILGGQLGLRNFPDANNYFGKPNDWRNNYYDVMQGILSEYVMGGEPRWFDRAEDQCLHVMDVDICHGRPDHLEWLGVLYGPGTNHASGWWSAMLRAEGLDTYYRLSGDRDALAAFLSVADFIARQRAGIGSVSVRDHAGALITLVRAYDETWDQKYLKAARRLAHDAISRLDSRRGCYSERHGNHNYRGNIPWMCAQLIEPLYLYYRCSGDVAAAQAVVGLAESLMVENRTGKGPGDFHGYSHNPHYNPNNGYNVLIAPAMGYAWELTEDAAFEECMRDALKRTVAEKSVNWVGNCYWNTPTVLYYLSHRSP